MVTLATSLILLAAAGYAAAPDLGQNTEEVALEVGLSWEQIARLKSAGILG